MVVWWVFVVEPKLEFAPTARRFEESVISMLDSAAFGSALDLLLDTEALCKTTGVPAEAACSRAFFTVAAWARLRN